MKKKKKRSCKNHTYFFLKYVIFFQLSFAAFEQPYPPVSCFSVLIIAHQEVLFSMYNIFAWKIEKLLNTAFQTMLVFYFLLLSNNTLCVMFYTYTCYWDIFQYKYNILITSCTSGFKSYLFTVCHIISFFVWTSFYVMNLSSFLVVKLTSCTVISKSSQSYQGAYVLK